MQYHKVSFPIIQHSSKSFCIIQHRRFNIIEYHSVSFSIHQHHSLSFAIIEHHRNRKFEIFSNQIWPAIPCRKLKWLSVSIAGNLENNHNNICMLKSVAIALLNARFCLCALKSNQKISALLSGEYMFNFFYVVSVYFNT